MTKLNEPVLPDDYPIYGGYLYVADGKVVRSDYHGISAARFKKAIGASELRRCDIYGRAALKDSAPSSTEALSPQKDETP